jgi:hypothetical protein
MKIAEFSLHRHEKHRLCEQKTSSPKPTSTGTPAKGDKLEHVHTAPEWTKDRAESEDKLSLQVL